MTKGPLFNDNNKSFTTRDNLGINSVAASIQAELCPIVNTVTPRAFYWPFMVWNYYDFYVNSDAKEHKLDTFDKPFLKKNDYFFVLSNIINDNPDRYNLVGSMKTTNNYDDDRKGPYSYDETYFKTRYGGMQYYNAGCLTMGFITNENSDGETFEFPKLTKELGEPMALAFESVIKDTEYYKIYRLSNKPVPKAVLEEFGKVATLDLSAFNECKKLLRRVMFQPTKNIRLDNTDLIQSSEYVKFIYKTCDAFKGKGVAELDAKALREVLFDYYSPVGMCNYDHDHNLDEIISKWEVVVGRQYFTIAIEMIWKHLLFSLSYPMALQKWIETSLKDSVHKVKLDDNLDEYISDSNFSFKERETMISKGAYGSKDSTQNIDIAIRLLLSMYNRFVNRDDIEKSLLEAGGEISISGLISLVEEYRDKPVLEFILYIIENWIIKQHHETAFNKMLQGRDGYFFEVIDGLYYKKADTYPEFQGIRLLQLMRVMLDLDMLEN